MMLRYKCTIYLLYHRSNITQGAIEHFEGHVVPVYPLLCGVVLLRLRGIRRQTPEQERQTPSTVLQTSSPGHCSSHHPWWAPAQLSGPIRGRVRSRRFVPSLHPSSFPSSKLLRKRRPTSSIPVLCSSLLTHRSCDTSDSVSSSPTPDSPDYSHRPES
jgi:hypothetical protein